MKKPYTLINNQGIDLCLSPRVYLYADWSQKLAIFSFIRVDEFNYNHKMSIKAFFKLLNLMSVDKKLLTKHQKCDIHIE